WGCDFLACSAYKFFGPHVGILWGRADLLRELPAYKVRPASESLPDRWMTGTQNHEGIAGVGAAVDYLADLGRQVMAPGAQGLQPLGLRPQLRAALEAIRSYEAGLCVRLLAGLAERARVRVWGGCRPRRVGGGRPAVPPPRA